VFKNMKDLIMSVVDGFNVCIFAYGQTGSGKTYVTLVLIAVSRPFNRSTVQPFNRSSFVALRDFLLSFPFPFLFPFPLGDKVVVSVASTVLKGHVVVGVRSGLRCSSTRQVFDGGERRKPWTEHAGAHSPLQHGVFHLCMF
jgi:hypothetical protein